MTKYKALQDFYNSFGVDAYEENSVPKKVREGDMPYITYEVITGAIENSTVAISCQLFFKTNSLLKINNLTEKIYKALANGKKLKCDDGYIILYRGTPFSMNRPTVDNSVKAKYINITAEYITI